MTNEQTENESVFWTLNWKEIVPWNCTTYIIHKLFTTKKVIYR